MIAPVLVHFYLLLLLELPRRNRNYNRNPKYDFIEI